MILCNAGLVLYHISLCFIGYLMKDNNFSPVVTQHHVVKREGKLEIYNKEVNIIGKTYGVWNFPALS